MTLGVVKHNGSGADFVSITISQLGGKGSYNSGGVRHENKKVQTPNVGS